MRATFLAGGGRVLPNTVASGLRSIDLAPTIAYLLGVPEPQHARASCAWIYSVVVKPVPWCRCRLTDFHGQLEQTTFSMDGRNITVGGAPTGNYV